MLEPADLPSMLHDWVAARVEQVAGRPLLDEYPQSSRLLVAVAVVWITVRLTHCKARRDKRLLYDAWIARARQERDDDAALPLPLPAAALATTETADTETAADPHRHHHPHPTDWMSATALRQALMAGETTREQVVMRAWQRCRDAREAYNCVAQELFLPPPQAASLSCSSAEDTTTTGATSTDDNTTNEQKLLYGVPISVKECLGVKGTYSTGGLACRLHKKVQQDCLVVQILKEQAGAVPVVTGNVTQLMFLPESVNRIWGRTVNPFHKGRSPGGSSGGDAALVACGAVPLAVGSDVAGSLRIPAAFCGIVAFKPTPSRASGVGCMRPRRHDRSGTHVAIPVSIGPLARTVDDCALYLRATAVPALWQNDPNLPPLPFREQIYNQSQKAKLKIGYFDSDGWFEPCATSKRAVRETVDHLQKAGHSVEKFDLPTDGWHSYGLLVAINSAEGNMRNFLDALEGEPLIAEYRKLRIAANLPNWLRPVASLLFLDARRSHLLQQARSGGISTYDFQQRLADLVEMRQKWGGAIKDWDALIFPSMPIPALPHGTSGDLTSACSYMFLANMLQWPSGSVPVTTVRADEVPYDVAGLPANQRDAIATLVATQVCDEGSVGLPVGVSVMTAAYQDELCLRVMKEVEDLVQFRERPPPTKSTKQ